MNLGFNRGSGFGGAVFAGNLPMLQAGVMKSTQEKQQRREKAQGQIEFWEKQKENLKSMECSTVEEIERKLEMFHTYEDQVKAAKAAYNNEQMFHVLDEAFEQGEKNAEAAEKTKPKTEEERKEEVVEEALGSDEEKGVLTEVMDEIMEEALEQLDEMTDIAQETEAALKAEKVPEAGEPEDIGAELLEAEAMVELERQMYKRFDVRI